MPTPILALPYPSSADTADVPRDIKALADAVDPLGTVPTGALMLWPTDVAPGGWLLCKGGQVNAATYPKLALVLGATAGVITLPDFTDRFPVGTGATPVLGVGGVNAVALATNQLPAHNHAVTDPGHLHGTDQQGYHAHNFTTSGSDVVDPQHTIATSGGWRGSVANFTGPGAINVPESTAVPIYGISGSHSHVGTTDGQGNHGHNIDVRSTGISIQNTGAGATHENRPAFRAINFIIRAI